MNGDDVTETNSSSDLGAVVARFINDELIEEDEDLDFSVEPTPNLSEYLDSQGLLELAGFLEYEFGVEIDDAEIVVENFGTLPDLVRLVEAKRGAVSREAQ
jgi:acyl carrier protein